MNLKSSFKFFFLVMIMVQACASKPATLQSTDDKIIEDYLKIHDQFVKKMCTPKDLDDHKNLLKEYRGTGYYIPELGDNHLDVDSLEAILPLFEEKMAWINEERENLKKKTALPDISKRKSAIVALVKKLLVLKFKHFYETNKKDKETLVLDSKKLHFELYKELAELLYSVSWLKSFKFPVDHLYNRNKYDTLKSAPPKVAKANKKHREKIQSNYIYLLRKVLEDGAQEPDHTKSDLPLRAAIDTLYLSMKEEKSFLSENNRYDLDYVLSQIQKQLDRGRGAQIDRLSEWYERTKLTLDFYKKLIASQMVTKSEGSEADRMLKELSVDRFNLLDFTMKKQVQVYQFWSEQSDLMKSLYVMETILYNEVGSVDGREGLERRDVSQVVYNRFIDKYYQKLPTKNNLYTYLIKVMKDEQIQKESWLNVMFKEGEFSFTYYFIPSSYKVFCPDVSRTGKYLQKENLKIALEVLRQPRLSFKATRYFSRASMTGRIDMTTVWNDFVPISEREGAPVTEISRLQTQYKQNKHEVLYSFKNPDGVFFDVLEINKENYVIKHSTSENPEFFSWRNPHNFIYFKKD